MKSSIMTIVLAAVMSITAHSAIGFSDSRFENSTAKGTLGETTTAEMMKSRGYKSLSTKVSVNQGLDHVFIKYNSDGTVDKIVVCETKTDSSAYNPEQMSDKRIQEQIGRMKADSDPEVRKTGHILEENRAKITKEHWHHDTRTGKTTINDLGPDGGKVGEKASFNTKKVQDKLLAQQHATSSTSSRQKRTAPSARNGSLEDPHGIGKRTVSIKSQAPVKAFSSKRSVAKVADEMAHKSAGRLAVSAEKSITRQTTYVITKAGQKVIVPIGIAVDVWMRMQAVQETEKAYAAGTINEEERWRQHAVNGASMAGGTAGAFVGGIIGAPFGVAGEIVCVCICTAAGDWVGGKIGGGICDIAYSGVHEKTFQTDRLAEFYKITQTPHYPPDDMKAMGFSENECAAMASWSTSTP